MVEPKKRTDEDVQKLKDSWIFNPESGLEFTEGFEAHRDELRTFCQNYLEQQSTQKKDNHFAKITKKANELSCSFALAEHIDALESKIKALENGKKT